MRVNKLTLKALILIPLLIVLCFATTIGAQDQLRLEITNVDSSAFPTISFNVLAVEAESQRLSSLTGMTINENGVGVEAVDSSDVQVGLGLIFVIDDNSGINANYNDGKSRWQKVQESIALYVTDYMSNAQIDRVSIITPNDENAEILVDRAVFKNAVFNGINFYEVKTLFSTPLNEMMDTALDIAAEDGTNGRFQAVVLFSDAGQLAEQLDYTSLVSKAQANSVPIFGAILGTEASDLEVANMDGLVDPTGGFQLHLVDSADTNSVFSRIQDNASQHQITYRSKANTSGQHSVVIDLAGARGEMPFNVSVSPPVNEIMVDNSTPIHRALPSPDAALNLAEPGSQRVVFRVSWPDGHPRNIREAALLVDGSVHSQVSDPQSDDNGRLELSWDISTLDEGAYELLIQVTD